MADLDQLARHAAGGDRDALEVLCRALNDEVWRYCRALTGDREIAFEGAQETFVRLVAAIRRYRGDGPVRPFVFTIARRCVIAAQRAQRRAGAVAVPPPAPAPDHAGHVEATLLLADLQPDQREAFILTQLLGLSYAEAGRVMRCPAGTIRSRVHRARERLITALWAAAASDVEEA